MSNKITVIGAGNGGHALSFHLSQQGHEVLLFDHPNFTKGLDGIKKKGGIEAIKEAERCGIKLEGKLTGFVEVSGTTTDPKEAMSFADIVLMIVPAFAQKPMFELIIPHLQDNQILVLMPGNFGALILNKMMKEKKINKKVILAETNSIIHGCRIIGEGQVHIVGVKYHLDIGFLPSSQSNDAIKRLEPVLPLKLILRKTILDVPFDNMNMVVHPATEVLNIGRCEATHGEFYFYREGMSESVSKVLEKINEERKNIGTLLGVKPTDFLDVVKNFYDLDYESIHEFAEKSPFHNALGYDAPSSPKFRYISEDIPDILVPVYEFGQIVDAPCEAIKSIITLGSIMNNTNYFETGRRLIDMGLENQTKDEISEMIS